MDLFLKEYPDYGREAAFLAKIENKEVYSEIGDIDGHVAPVSAATLKRLARWDARKSRTMRDALKKIADKETTGVERLVYRLVSGRTVEFDDIRTKILFYKEFWSFRKFFRNKTESTSFVMAELLYLKAYFNKDISRRAAARLEQMPPLDRVFYFLAFARHLDRRYALGFSKVVDTMHLASPRIDHRLMVFSVLPEDDFYACVSSYLLYAGPAETVGIVRNLGDSVDFGRLVLVMLDECFSSRLAIDKVYAEHLRLISLLGLGHGLRLRLLYSWMRYFLAERLFGRFHELARKIGETRPHDDEFEFYRQFDEFIRGRLDLRTIKARFEDFDDTNHCAKHSLKQIIGMYSD